MASRLDTAPPLPPGATPGASLSTMAGGDQGSAPQGGSAQTPGGGASKMTSVVEKLMGAEKMLQDAGSIMPELAPIIDDVVSRLRAGAGKVINNSAQGGGSPASPSATPPSAGSGLMATPMPPAMGGQ